MEKELPGTTTSTLLSKNVNVKEESKGADSANCRGHFNPWKPEGVANWEVKEHLVAFTTD